MTEETTSPSLKVRYNNYGGTNGRIATVDGEKNTGINIYSQKFSREKAFSTQNNEHEITGILEKVIEIVKQEGDESTYKLENAKISDNAYQDVKFVNENTNTFKMDKNQILVFKSIQGPKGTADNANAFKYVTYYCYLKDFEGNVWLIYIPSSELRPVIFDLQDNLEPKFGGEYVEGNRVIKLVDTGNFELIRKFEGINSYWVNDVELKNTAFNLASDDKSEDKAHITYYGVFVAQAQQK